MYLIKYNINYRNTNGFFFLRREIVMVVPSKKKRNTNGCRYKTTTTKKSILFGTDIKIFLRNSFVRPFLDRVSYEHMCYMFVRDVLLKTDAVYISLFTNRFMACMRGAHSLNRFRGFDQKLRHYFFIKKTNLK